MKQDDELLQQLEEDAEPVEIASYSSEQGIYGFFLHSGSLPVGVETLAAAKSSVLLYIGKTESSQEDRDVGEHLTDGKTGSSTVRRSLGALLREQLNLKPQPRSATEKSAKRFTNYKFDAAGEGALTVWMKKHLSLSFCELADLKIPELRALEKRLIGLAKPPLNIQDNSESPYLADLESARAHCAALARECT